MKNNYKMLISYDGSRYYGWEHQPNTDLTIQGKLETVLSRMTDADPEHPVTVIGAGRTDAGVHAKAMCANVILDTEMTEEEIFSYLNRYLPDDIGVNEVKIAAPRFHSRFKAKGKTYCYTCWYGTGKPVFDRKYVTVLDQKPDIGRMREAASFLEGEHDFKSFCGNPKMKKSTVRRIFSVLIREEGPYLRIFYNGSGFLQHMVRIMTGTLLEIGYGKRKPSEVADILEARDRRKAGPTAPAKGLCLEEVFY